MTDPIRGVLGTRTAGDLGAATGAKTGQATTGAAAAGTSAAPGADSADVGGTRSLLQTIDAAAAAVPTVNAGQVEALRHAISQGTYRVDPRQVAKGLLNTDAALPAAAGE